MGEDETADRVPDGPELGEESRWALGFGSVDGSLGRGGRGFLGRCWIGRGERFQGSAPSWAREVPDGTSGLSPLDSGRSGGDAEGSRSEPVRSVEEAVRPAGRGRRGCDTPTARRLPDQALHLVDPGRQLRRTPGRRDIGIRSTTGRESDGLVGQAWNHGQHDTSVSERHELPGHALLDHESRRAQPSPVRRGLCSDGQCLGR